MIKPLASLLILLIFSVSLAQETADSSSSLLEAEASLSLNSNGIAYIPAFSLDKPAIIGTLSLKKGRFSYDPQLSYGLNLKPWIIDNWFHYRIVNRTDFELKAGGVFSAFFSELETPDEPVLQVQKYLAAELVASYNIAPFTSLAFTYLIDRGQDPGTLSGHFFNLQAKRSEFKLGQKGLLLASLQVFYIDYTGSNDGLFTAAFLSATIRNIPFSLFFQAIQDLWTNMDPSPAFKWNVGLAYHIATPGV
jgi:hypothetical protein